MVHLHAHSIFLHPCPWSWHWPQTHQALGSSPSCPGRWGKGNENPMKTSSTGGATDSLHLCKQDLETDPSWCWAVQGRLKILSSNLTPADLFSSLGKLKKKIGEGEGKCLWKWLCGLPTCIASMQRCNPEQWLLGYPWSGVWSPRFVQEGWWARAEPRDRGKEWILLSSGHSPTGLRGVLLWSSLRHWNLQCLWVCKKVIKKMMLSLCPGPFWKSTVKE